MERTLSYSEAVLEATQQEMARDSSVMVMGIGVDDFTAVFGTTRGLVEQFGPDRVLNTPLSEDAMTGAAIGAATGDAGIGAAIGAGSGLLLGSAAASSQAQWAGETLQRRYDNAYLQCMYANGNQIPLPQGAFAAHPPLPAPPAGAPPPPPPGAS